MLSFSLKLAKWASIFAFLFIFNYGCVKANFSANGKRGHASNGPLNPTGGSTAGGGNGDGGDGVDTGGGGNATTGGDTTDGTGIGGGGGDQVTRNALGFTDVVDLTPHYATCVNLAKSGKIAYETSAKCPNNSAIVVVNDGSGPEFTCCPFKGSKVLSDNQAERHILRNEGLCQAGEVATGMIRNKDGGGKGIGQFGVYCSKFKTQYLIEKDYKQALYTTKEAVADPSYKVIVNQYLGAYDKVDACMCPQGYWSKGADRGLRANDRCGDICVLITEKP